MNPKDLVHHIGLKKFGILVRPYNRASGKVWLVKKQNQKLSEWKEECIELLKEEFGIDNAWEMFSKI